MKQAGPAHSSTACHSRQSLYHTLAELRITFAYKQIFQTGAFGRSWQFYRTGNSAIPFNMVNVIAEVESGVLWVGTAHPTEVGGILAEFDRKTWKTYTVCSSGFSGAEPLAIAQDAQERWWIGTRTAGLDIYQAKD